MGWTEAAASLTTVSIMPLAYREIDKKTIFRFLAEEYK